MLSAIKSIFKAVVLAALLASNLNADSTDGSINEQELIALSEVAPEVYYQLRRYPKFYGDVNTTHGSLTERSQLLGDVGGLRDQLVDRGIFIDVDLTQFAQQNVSGGNDTGSARTNGSIDYWLTVDTGKAGLWSGGAFMVHAESSWNADSSVNKDTGSLLPANFDATAPTPDTSETFVIPEVYFMQALPHDLLLIAGKVNWAGTSDGNLFANNEKTEFTYTGLVNNPILGAFAPYTSLGVALSWAPENHNLTVFGIQKNGNASTSGFDEFNGEGSYGFQYQYSPIINDRLPGNYRIIGGYTNQEQTSFDIDARHLIGEIIGLVPIEKEDNNYALLVNFDQYLWVKEGSVAAYKESLKKQPHNRREHQPPVGIGLFGRAGWAPKDRNVIDQFYSFGIGGYGMLIPGRDYDRWGLGWAGTHISSDLRDDADVLGIEVNEFEHAFEAFYNFEITPAVNLSFNVISVESADDSVDRSLTLGTRLQVDF